MLTSLWNHPPTSYFSREPFEPVEPFESFESFESLTLPTDLEVEPSEIVKSVYNEVFKDEDEEEPVEEEEPNEPGMLCRVKPMYYTLETQTPDETVAHLTHLNGPLNLARIQNYPGKIRFGRLTVPTDTEFFHTLIGTNGYFLQQTCQTWDLIAIIPIGNELFFWGTRTKVIKAMNILRHRIQVCGQRLQVDVSAY
jgi:hypothetical protein